MAASLDAQRSPWSWSSSPLATAIRRALPSVLASFWESDLGAPHWPCGLSALRLSPATMHLGTFSCGSAISRVRAEDLSIQPRGAALQSTESISLEASWLLAVKPVAPQEADCVVCLGVRDEERLLLELLGHDRRPGRVTSLSGTVSQLSPLSFQEIKKNESRKAFLSRCELPCGHVFHQVIHWPFCTSLDRNVSLSGW